MAALSFYGDVFDATAAGIAVKRRLDDIAAAGNQATAATAPADLRAMSSQERDDEKDNLEKGRCFQIGQLRKAVACFRQMEDVNSLQVAGCLLVKDAKGNVKETTAPIVIFNWQTDDAGNKTEKTGHVGFTIGSFLRMDVEEARKKGGTREELGNTLSREEEEGEELRGEAEGF